MVTRSVKSNAIWAAGKCLLIHLNLVHVTDGMIELYWSALLTTGIGAILAGQRCGPAGSRRHAGSNCPASSSRNGVLKLVHTSLLLLMDRSLLLLTSGFQGRQALPWHDWTNSTPAWA